MVQNLITDLESLNTEKYSETEVSYLTKFTNTLKNIGTFVSDLFKKTTTLTINPHSEQFTVNEKNIRNFLKEVADKEAEAGNPTFWVDNDIWNWDTFKNKTFAGFVQQITTTIYRFLQTLTHGQVIDEGKKTNVHKMYSFVEALCIAKTLLLSNEIQFRNTGVFVYFQIPGNNQLFRFRCCRDDDGKLGLNVGKVGSGSRWDAGNGVCFSNEPSVN